MVHLRTLDGLGPMPEVLHGRYYKRLENGSPHQMFSEIAIQNGFYEGLLGLESDVPAALIRLAPHLPAVWPRLKVHRIPVGDGSLDLRIEKDRTSYELAINLDFPEGMTVVVEPALPAGSEIKAVTLDGKPCAFQVRRTPASTAVFTKVPQAQGKHVLHISHKGGIDFFPVDSPLRPGDTTRNLRIIRAAFDNSEWQMILEGLPDKVYAIDFFTDDEPRPRRGCDFTQIRPPCRSTIFLQIARPMPVPAYFGPLCNR